ncbi:MAG: hypothetical protein LBE56_12655 [Tannerella sp.]|jgi:hypothetical protein|nr:hypothetical protein [Tannerella sp.]
MKKQRWINNYNTVGDFDGAKPSFIECHVGGIGAFQKSSTFPAIVDDAPVNDGTYSAAWDAIFNLNRPWRNTPPDDWVGEFDDIVYWMALEIKWGMRGFAIAYDNGNKNRVSGNFDNTNPLNVFTKLPSIDDGNRLVSLSNFLSGNYNCKEISYFDMSNVTSLSNAFSNSVVETFPSIKYNTLKVENISGIFAN